MLREHSARGPAIPMRRLTTTLASATLLVGLLAPPVSGAPLAPQADDDTAPDAGLSSGQLQLHFVTGGLASPLGVVSAGDGTNRLFVVEKRGTVRVVANRKLLPGFFLDVRGYSGGFRSDGERGLLGLAFHPDFATNRKLFVYFTRGDGDLIIAEMTANATRTSASLSTLDPIINPIEHSTYSNHNGGQLLFGPDENLYIFTGDGGGGGDPFRSSQNINSRLGKILRVTPNLNGGVSIPSDNPYVGENGDDIVWARGLRNPWRNSFDRDSGALYVADVGQGTWEEINRDTSLGGGRNYGWSNCEGASVYYTGPCPGLGQSSGGLTGPIAQYGHPGGNCSVTGGHVYRGSVYADMYGEYVLGDFCSGRIWTITHGTSSLVLRRDTSLTITSFGESESGELYMTDYGGGRLYKVVAPPFSDVANSIFVDEITWLEAAGITGGCNATQFCPKANVLRGQMAAFLGRALDLPATGTDYFIDDETSQFEFDINRLAAAGITGGCGPQKFCPGFSVSRGQMASFLVRALDLPSTGTDYFDDDDGSIHEDDINALRAAGITGGCAPNAYCPGASVTREQMASFLYRAFSE